jgi:AcrR family transcriptional regulator
MLQAAVRLISTQGSTGAGPREIAAASDAPRGSLQHYFPGGKDQLVTKAITIADEVAAGRVLRLAGQRPSCTPGAPSLERSGLLVAAGVSRSVTNIRSDLPPGAAVRCA